MGRPPGRRGPGRPRGGGRLAGRPAGRPRRSSNSTVASIDFSHVKYAPESTVLKSTTDAYVDDWPIFVLKDVVVYRKAANAQLEIANICNVDLDGPFIIRGRLDVDINQEHYRTLLQQTCSFFSPLRATTNRATTLTVRNPSHRASYIEIPANTIYSVGYGPWPVVWAAGKAGWFEINPAPEYEVTYEAVCEGITLYYELMSVYDRAKGRASKTKRQKALQMPIEKLLFKVRPGSRSATNQAQANCEKYAVSIGDGVTLVEAKKRCQKHAPFLLAHFPRELESDTPFNWSVTSFAKWMASENKVRAFIQMMVTTQLTVFISGLGAKAERVGEQDPPV